MSFFKNKIYARLWWAPWVLVSFIALILSYALGFYIAQYTPKYTKEREKKLYQQWQHSKQRVQTLQRDLAQLKVGAQIDRKAVEEVQKQVTDLEYLVADQKDEIAFYRDYIDPKTTLSRVLVRSWKLYANVGSVGSVYDYKLVLQSAKASVDEEELSIRFELEYENSGSRERNTLFIDDIENVVRFKYFKTLRGQFSIPENIIPKRMIIHLTMSNGKQYQKKYAWLVN